MGFWKKKKIFLFITLLIVLGIVFSLGACRKREGVSSSAITLTYYKLYDDEDVMKPLIAKFQASHPNISVRYRKFEDVEAYEDMLLDEMAEGEGPDIFEVRNASVPRYIKKITPLQSTTITAQYLEQNFVATVAKDFVQVDPKDNLEKIFGLPLSIDVPVIYYNKALFERLLPEKGKPSETWDELTDDISKLRDENEGNLKRGGLSMGRSDNIAMSFEILMNLFLQKGVNFYSNDFKRAVFAGSEGTQALEFYLSFADPKFKQYGWSEFLAPKAGLKEVEAFLGGKVAMMVGYSDLLSDLNLHRKNLKAKGLDIIDEDEIGIAPLPQESKNPEEQKVFAWYFGETVSRNSKHPKEAWQLIYFLSEQAQAKKYVEQTKKLSARRDLLEDQKKDRNLSAFVKQAGIAESFPIYNERKYREFFEEAVMLAVNGLNQPSAVLKDAQEYINELLPEDGVFPK